MATRFATDKQLQFIQSLLGSKDTRPMHDQDAGEALGHLHAQETITVSEASHLIDVLKALPRKQNEVRDDRPWTSLDGNHDPAPTVPAPSQPTEELEQGVYEFEDAVYVVKWNRQRTGQYAKKAVEVRSDRLLENGRHIKIDFEYAPGIVRWLRPEHKMPLTRAREFAIKYGQCIRCGRFLKVAESVERMLGPVCVTYFA